MSAAGTIVKSVFAVGFLVDQFGYAGEGGGKLLRTNDITRPAAPYYEGLGKVMNFAWREGVLYYAKGINDIVQKHDNP